MASSSQSVLRLYREMLRNASKFEVRGFLRVLSPLEATMNGLTLGVLCRWVMMDEQGYNYRSYALRRVKEDFHKNKALAPGSAEQQQALARAREQANVLYRQVVVSKMYPPEAKSIMDMAH